MKELRPEWDRVKLALLDEVPKDAFTLEGWLAHVATYAQGIGCDKASVVRDPSAPPSVSPVVECAHKNGLYVHCYTFRTDPHMLHRYGWMCRCPTSSLTSLRARVCVHAVPMAATRLWNLLASSIWASTACSLIFQTTPSTPPECTSSSCERVRHTAPTPILPPIRFKARMPMQFQTPSAHIWYITQSRKDSSSRVTSPWICGNENNTVFCAAFSLCCSCLCRAWQVRQAVTFRSSQPTGSRRPIACVPPPVASICGTYVLLDHATLWGCV